MGARDTPRLLRNNIWNGSPSRRRMVILGGKVLVSLLLFFEFLPTPPQMVSVTENLMTLTPEASLLFVYENVLLLILIRKPLHHSGQRFIFNNIIS